MSNVRVQSFGVSLDGYSAGPNQSLENPLGYQCTEHVVGERAMHVILQKRS